MNNCVLLSSLFLSALCIWPSCSRGAVDLDVPVYYTNKTSTSTADPGMADKTVIYVYKGLGAGPISLKMLLKALGRWTDSSRYAVRSITPEEILQGNWTEDAALVAFGGGFDSGFVKSLGKEGMAIIRNYVLAGGSYLGLCAGGYFGCAEVEFDKGGPLQVLGQRDLRFFPGKCIGPAFPDFDYNSNRGARAARVNWTVQDSVSSSNLDVNVYFNGGGKFEPYNNDTLKSDTQTNSYEYLGLYTELDGAPPAIVKCSVGQGVAVLSGVHYEYFVEDLDESDPYLKKLIPKLKTSLKYREICFKSILKHLRL